MTTPGPVPGPRPQVAVGAVVVADGALLLVRRGTEPEAGRWSLPGGRLEAGESVRSAVERELVEETGLSGDCGALVGWVERRGAGYHYVILDFVVTGPRVADAPRAGGDAAEAAWVTLADVPDRDLVGGLAQFLRDHDVIDG